MAEARNKFLSGLADEPVNWLVVIDADLHTKPEHIWQLIDVLHGSDDVIMVCVSAL